MVNARIPIPRVASDFVHIYKPDGDYIPNDFSILLHDGTFHMVGITQHRPEGFIDAYNHIFAHENEFQFFHCTTSGTCFSDVFYPHAFHDETKLLYPAERPDEIPEIHAPHLAFLDGRFKMIYGPRNIRIAETNDFLHWQRRVLFSGEATLRDPYLFFENGLYYVFDTVDRRIVYRTSHDLHVWSDAVTLQTCPYRDGAPESPFFCKRGEYYYLLWSIWDTRNGSYDERCFVFGAKTIADLADTAPLTILPAHAPELFEDETGSYLLSVFYPQNGISAAKLIWD